MAPVGWCQMREGETTWDRQRVSFPRRRSRPSGHRESVVRVQADRRAVLRNQLIIYYSPFVKYVAGRVLAGLPRHFDEEDLVSYGIIGLIDAIERFEPDRNLRFETYAIPRIKGAIIDELRSIDWVPRSVRTKARAVEQAFTHLEATLAPHAQRGRGGSRARDERRRLPQGLRKISSVGMMALDEVLRGGERSERSTLGETLPDGHMGPGRHLRGQGVQGGTRSRPSTACPSASAPS